MSNQTPKRRVTVLPGTELQLSRLAFGTAHLHHLSSDKARHALLETAVAHGITHFDTAPLYGYGMAERTLAPLLAAEPALTVTTKVGLYAPGGADQSQLSMLARKVLGKVIPGLSRAQADFGLERARASFGDSLNRLGRERVDLLLIHEPDITLMQNDEWLRWLEKEEKRGRIGAFGIAGATSQVSPFLSANSPLAKVVQTADSLSDCEADIVIDAGRPLQITYGYLSSARSAGAQFDARDVLADALRRNASGTVLVSTRQPARLAEFAAAMAIAG